VDPVVAERAERRGQVDRSRLDGADRGGEAGLEEEIGPPGNLSPRRLATAATALLPTRS
jgi:hypothetical protein